MSGGHRPSFTPKQGKYLAFIDAYTRVQGTNAADPCWGPVRLASLRSSYAHAHGEVGLGEYGHGPIVERRAALPSRS
jgi:hypothetical protein